MIHKMDEVYADLHYQSQLQEQNAALENARSSSTTY
jgi:hypothetical protein